MAWKKPPTPSAAAKRISPLREETAATWRLRQALVGDHCLAAHYARLGASVAVIDAAASLLASLDPEAGDTLKRHMEKLGASFVLSSGA